MQRRNLLSLASLILAGMIPAGAAVAAEKPIKIGAVAPKTGPLAGGAAVTQWPTIKLWVSDVNGRGGLKMKDGTRRTIELVEYDFIIAPYGTGLNLASAPVFAKYGYPQIAVSAITDKTGELAKRYPGIFFTLGNTTAFAQSVADILSQMVKEGKIGKRVAMVNVADAFGIELAEAARPIFKKAGLEIVYDKSYPLGAQDLASVVKGAKAATPDAFVAWSYPPDTFGLTELAKIEGLNVKAFYAAVATCFPAYAGKFQASAENVLGAGGINVDAAELAGYFDRHQKVTGVGADYWAGPVTYASLQVLEQSIEAVGTDRATVTNHIKSGSFKTVLGDWKFNNQVIDQFWTVGQWQGGKFVGVASTGKTGAKSVQVKTGW